jgi:PGF-CTERM protein
MKNNVKAALAVLMIMSMIAVALPANADKAGMPTSTGNPYPASAYVGIHGSIQGRVTTSANGTIGIGTAYIAIVNASNNSMEYFNTTSDAYGNYQVIGLNATYSSVLHTGIDGTTTSDDWLNGTQAYRIYANKSPYGEGWSAAFGIDANNSGTTYTAVTIQTKPAKIMIVAERSHVVADKLDNIKITAYMYDALGNPVANGYLINFTIGNATNNSFLLGGYPYNSPMNGSLNTVGTSTVNGVPTNNNDGSASVQFGWVDDAAGGMNSTIWAYYNDDVSISASVKIYFQAPTASWTGYVVDSAGTGYPSLPVTLHVVGWNSTTSSPYEIYTMNRTTSASQPFVGLYVFDYIVLTNASYGYVTAQATITDNLTIYGKSNNYTMNKSATSIGSIVLSIPPPDALKVTAQYDTILVGGSPDWIIAQLMLNGFDYKRSGQPVTFNSSNDTVATLPTVKTNSTDLNGQAWILLTSNNTVGTVNITGNTTIMYGHDLSDTCMVRVVGWGTVSGIVSDENKIGIPNANVTLYNVQWNNTTGQWENTVKVNIPENPQLSNDGRNGQTIGLYTYYRVPWNVYNVTGEKEGHVYFAVFCLGPWPSDIAAYSGTTQQPGSEFGTATHNIAIPDYTFISPTTTPSVTPTTSTPTATPTVTPTPTPTPTPGFETIFALAGLLGVAYLIARKEN